MLTWLAPAWLAAAAAAALPVLLHLWSRGQARRVRVGSVSWLRPAQGLRGRRFRPSDPVLLAVRVGFWLLLAAALAGPRWPDVERSAAADAPVWALISRDVPDGPELRAALDRFTADMGRPLRFHRLREPAATPLWSLLVEADRVAPRDAGFLLVAPLEVARLGGERPRLARAVRVLDWPRPAAVESAPLTPAPLPVVWTGDWAAAPEARDYVVAALDAAAGALGVTLVPSLEAADELGVRAGERVLVVATPSPDVGPCREPQLVRAGGVEHRFRRTLCSERDRTPIEIVTGEIRGRDGYGRPWLWIDRRGGHERWQLRIPPTIAASDLVVSAAWPAMVADFLSAAAPAADRRRVDPRQAVPAPAEAAPDATLASWPEALAWLGVAGLLAVERRMAARRTAS